MMRHGVGAGSPDATRRQGHEGPRGEDITGGSKGGGGVTEAQQLWFDTIIAGGEVIDPAAGFNGKLDIGIKQGRIAAVEPALDPQLATNVIDASGQLVTPGLVDLHTHIYWGATFWGIEPDPVAARSGVTSWLDVGSAGAYSFPGFRRYVAEANRSRVFAFLNLSAIGLIAPTWEFANPDYWDVDLATTIIEANRDLILGIKARIDKNTTRGVGVAPLIKARELADRVGLPLMVHIGSGPPTLAEITGHLRPGDILTHCFTGQDMRILGQDGVPDAAIRELQARGLILDIGHGAGSFSYEVAEQMMVAGVLPDVISSDIHQISVQGPMFDMPTTLSKFLNLGLGLPEVIARATSRPAAAMGRPDLGTIAVGSVADIALFELKRGDYRFHDIHMAERPGEQLLVSTRTLIDGKVLPPCEERPPLPWAVLSEAQQIALRPV